MVPQYMQINVGIRVMDSRLTPLRAHPTDAGADLFSTETTIIYPQDQKLIDTGVAIQIPLGFAGMVFNRSSQGKLRIQIANGTGIIDSDYRGNIKVLLVNNGLDPYEIKEFDTRIAQLVITPIMLSNFVRFIGNDEDWFNTVRGIGGFGSTGV